jgi:hypothetical protein
MIGTVVVIVSAFFVIGIVVGIIAVIAMSVLRGRRGDPAGPLDYERRGPGGQQPGRWIDADPDDPRWPGDADDDAGGR